MRDYLEFEKPIREIEEKIEKLAAANSGKASTQEEIADVLSLRLQLPARVQHMPDNQAAGYGGKNIVGKNVVGRLQAGRYPS